MCRRYYAEFFGYECEDLEVETEDGFVLRVHHLLSKKHKARTLALLGSTFHSGQKLTEHNVC